MTSSDQPIELDEQRATQVARLAEINDTIRELTTEADTLKGALRPLGAGVYTFGGRKVLDLTGGATFDSAKARELLTPAQLEAITVTALSADLAKKLLAPGLYAMCCKPKSLSVKPAAVEAA